MWDLDGDKFHTFLVHVVQGTYMQTHSSLVGQSLHKEEGSTVEPPTTDSPYYGNIHKADKRPRSQIIPYSSLYMHVHLGQSQPHPLQMTGSNLIGTAILTVAEQLAYRHDTRLFLLAKGLVYQRLNHLP